MGATRPLWTAADAATATRGRPIGSWSATGVSIDNRTAMPGDLFVALHGPNFDGHAFVAQAFEAGCTAAMVSDAATLPAHRPGLIVDCTMGALEDLGRAGRARARARIGAVTGSVGKTGVKAALRLVLDRQGGCHANAGSFNNRWGVPLSLARLAGDVPYGVQEIGMNHAGEIAPLAAMTRPHVAIVTAVADAHIANFASRADIAREKAEVFSGVIAGGTAVINRDTPHFAILETAAAAAGIGTLVTFGRSRDADFRLIDAEIGPENSRIDAMLAGRAMTYRLGAPGAHWVLNSLGVLAMAEALGADAARAARDLADLRPEPGRGRMSRLITRDGGRALLIDDSYNANPDSMRAAFELLHAQMAARRIAVLGDMLELGETEAERHAALAETLTTTDIARVHTVGPRMRHLHNALPAAVRGDHADRAADLVDALKTELAGDDAILVKGSKDSGVGRIARALSVLSEDRSGRD